MKQLVFTHPSTSHFGLSTPQAPPPARHWSKQIRWQTHLTHSRT
uniref:Uncharacterized protein n=1 Tax=Anguilla anguilla TaxID=7936 RepID=A0A0E9QNL2_ANGAN